MRIFALELDNDVRGVDERKAYIETLIAALDAPDLVVLPELALCGYIPNQDIWQYADDCGRDALGWGIAVARKYDVFLGIGYVDEDGGDYYNRYMIVGKDGLCGTVTKSEGEAAVFKRGDFPNVIRTPFGNVGVAICYDARRRRFYDNVKDEELSLIIFPHGSPADPGRPDKEMRDIDCFCEAYEKAFGVPVVYVNSTGALAHMPGRMGRMMARAGFALNGRTRFYGSAGTVLERPAPEVYGMEASLSPQRLKHAVRFHGQDVVGGNWLFRKLVLGPDTRRGILEYERSRALTASS